MAGKQQTHYEIDMCNGPILSKMLRFSIPLMCSSVLQLLFNAADIVVVGRWAGDNSLAAVGSNPALIGLLTNLFVGLAVGANTRAPPGSPHLHPAEHHQRPGVDSGGRLRCPDHPDLDADPGERVGSGHAVSADLLPGHDGHHGLQLRRRPAAGGGRYPAAAVLPLPGGSRQHRAESLLRHRLQAGRGRGGHRHRDLPVPICRLRRVFPHEKIRVEAAVPS